MEFKTNHNSIVYGNEHRELARITYPTVAPGVVDIDHTSVDEELRGQGMAGKLMERCAAELEATGRKARTSCSYAAKWFENHPEYAHLLEK